MSCFRCCSLKTETNCPPVDLGFTLQWGTVVRVTTVASNYINIYIYRIAQLLLSHSQSALSECKPLRRMLAQEGPLKELVQL